jgi:hypothetical protein
METEREYKYIEDYYERLNELQKADECLESIKLVEEIGKIKIK